MAKAKARQNLKKSIENMKKAHEKILFESSVIMGTLATPQAKNSTSSKSLLNFAEVSAANSMQMIELLDQVQKAI